MERTNNGNSKSPALGQENTEFAGDINAQVEALLFPSIRNAHLVKPDLSQNRLSEWIRANPAPPEVILDALLPYFSDQNKKVREMALEQVVPLVCEHELKNKNALPVLLTACSDPYWSLRSKANSDLADLIRSGAKNEESAVDALLEACGTGQHPLTWITALDHLNEVIEIHPTRAGDMVAAVLCACAGNNYEVRVAGTKQLAASLKVCPDKADEIFTTLLRSSNDEDSTVRFQAMRQLAQSIEVYPEKSEEVAAALLQGCKDSDVYVRKSSGSVLVASMESWPDRVDEIIDEALTLARRDRFEITGEQMDPVTQMFERCLDNSSSLDAAVTRGCKDDHSLTTAKRLLALSAKACPQKASELVTVMLKSSNESNTMSRRTAIIIHLAEAVEFCPKKVEEVVFSVLSWCEDPQQRVRKAAMSQLGDLIKLSPSNSKEIMDAVFSGLRDTSVHVRLRALEQLGKVANACPDWAEIILKKLFISCRSNDARIRAAAMRRLPQMAHVLPVKARQITGALLTGCVDKEQPVSDAAKENLGEALSGFPEMAVELLATLIEKHSTERN